MNIFRTFRVSGVVTLVVATAVLPAQAGPAEPTATDPGKPLGSPWQQGERIVAERVTWSTTANLDLPRTLEPPHAGDASQAQTERPVATTSRTPKASRARATGSTPSALTPGTTTPGTTTANSGRSSGRAGTGGRSAGTGGRAATGGHTGTSGRTGTSGHRRTAPRAHTSGHTGSTDRTDRTSPKAPKNSPSGSGSGRIAVRFAYAQLGKPYRYGGDGPHAYDCSGLTMAAWRAAGVSLPHGAGAQFRAVHRVGRADLRPGDIVFYYSGIRHVGLYIGNGQVIDAPHSGDKVKVRGLHFAPIVGYGRPGKL